MELGSEIHTIVSEAVVLLTSHEHVLKMMGEVNCNTASAFCQLKFEMHV